MKFHPTDIRGAFIIEMESFEDNRGFFARTFCVKEFAEVGIEFNIAQCSMSFNKTAGTLRGLHYQAKPHQEDKIVRCINGAIWDVAVDIRPDSPSFRTWISVELSEENNLALYIPKGCAHGFQTLVDSTMVYYQMNAFYASESARGINHSDPSFGIKWPIGSKTISDKDLNLPNFVV